MNEETALTIPTDDKSSVEIIPFGTDERIKLNVAIVQKMVAVPTKSGKLPDTTQCIKFIMLCKARHLNPFEGDAYLIGYDTQSGPQFSLITAHQVFLKRAEASEGFDGIQSGVVIKTAEGIVDREGDIVFDEEKLLGGWARVYRKDRKQPFFQRIKLETFNTGLSRWNKDAAGMICKCAESAALRMAFPTHLGGLYIKEERPPLDVTPTIERPKFDTPQIQDAEPKKRGRKPKEQPAPAQGLRDDLVKRLSMGKYHPDDLMKLAIEKNWVDADATFKLLPVDKLSVLIETWDEVAKLLDERFASQGAPEPSDPLFA
jgi:phage recombination protein Bet